MNEKKSLIIAIGVSTAIAAGFGVLLYFQDEAITEKRAEADRLTGEIAQMRSTIASTPEVESQVILARETDDFVSGLLPNDDDVLNFARALSAFGKDSGVNITQLRDKLDTANRGQKKEDFRKVGYSINFDADAFQMLSLLDLVESHERFMRVPSFKLTAAQRSSGQDELVEAPLHSIAMEIETFVYEPQSGITPVEIDNYDRKAELLAGEVAQRRRSLEVPSYDYRGVRNRRDPWVDPRVPMVDGSGAPPIPIPEQLQLVEELERMGDRATELWEQWRDAPHLIAEMQARRDLEQHLSELEFECDTHEGDRVFTYFPALKRFEGVRETIVDVRANLEVVESKLPRVELLKGTIESIYAHMERRDFDRAWDAYRNIENRLPYALNDPLRRPLAQRIEELGTKIEIVIEFEALEIEIDGFVDLGPGKRVVLIDGRTYSPREIISPNLIVDEIFESRVDFIFKGVRISVPIETRLASR